MHADSGTQADRATAEGHNDSTAQPASAKAALELVEREPTDWLVRPGDARPGEPSRGDYTTRVSDLADGSLRQLRERKAELPIGHISSPFHEDGSLKEPAPRLTDFEYPEGPLSDEDYAAHVHELAKALDQAREKGLATHKQFSLDGDAEVWQSDRRLAHDSILNAVYTKAADVPCERRAILAGGLGGAGKTTVLEHHVDIDRSAYLTINPDDFKEELARRGMIPKVAGLSPMESSALVHEESSHLARQLALRAMADGKNIIWDITMSSSVSASRRVHELRDARYQEVNGIFVEIPIDVSVTRTEARHRHGHDQYLAGEGFGGRYVPPDVVRSQADEQYGSINRRAFEEVKGQFDNWVVYDNSVTGRHPILIESSSHKRPGDTT